MKKTCFNVMITDGYRARRRFGGRGGGKPFKCFDGPAILRDDICIRSFSRLFSLCVNTARVNVLSGIFSVSRVFWTGGKENCPFSGSAMRAHRLFTNTRGTRAFRGENEFFADTVRFSRLETVYKRARLMHKIFTFRIRNSTRTAVHYTFKYVIVFVRAYIYLYNSFFFFWKEIAKKRSDKWWKTYRSRRTPNRIRIGEKKNV